MEKKTNRANHDEQSIEQVRSRKKRRSPEKSVQPSEDKEEASTNGEAADEDNGNVVKRKDVFTDDDAPPVNETSSRKPKKSPSSAPTPPSSPPTKSWKPYIWILLGILSLVAFLAWNPSDQSQTDVKWRESVDPKHILSVSQRATIIASLRPILHKSAREEQEGVSTLLILSTNEQTAAQLGQCLLDLVNKKKNPHGLSTEIDLRSYRGGKQTLDTHLRSLLGPDGITRAVLLRHIDTDSFSSDAAALEHIRLLFAYCDGENPVIPHRLIIMTAIGDSNNADDLRHKFKIRWKREDDFVDALMSRISGHVVHVAEDQKSIC